MRVVALGLLVGLLLGGETIPLADGGATPVARLEAHGLTVAMLPELGGKLVSLRGPDGYEWLSRSGRPYRPRAGLVGFGDGEFDGADEIFPTMDACDDLPGHGEAWRLPWTRIADDGLAFALDGQRRPYRLERRITLAADAVELAYELRNRGDADLRYVYLFHPLFSLAEPLRMELPEAQQVAVTNSQHHFLRETPAPLPWSRLVEQHFAAATADTANKRFWSLAAAAPAFVRLRRPGGQTLTMTWDAEALPRMAVWCCEGSPFVGNLAHLAPEPVSGPTVKLAQAIADGTAASLPPQGVRRWRIRLAFAR